MASCLKLRTSSKICAFVTFYPKPRASTRSRAIILSPYEFLALFERSLETLFVYFTFLFSGEDLEFEQKLFELFLDKFAFSFRF